MVRLTAKGDFKKTERLLEKVMEGFGSGILDKYGQMGVDALRRATPVDTGKTSESWDYRIERNGKHDTKIIWTNTNINKGVNIAIILQYGHGTRNGGYVTGIDYINPAMRPIFEKIADEAAKEVSKL